MSDWLPARNRLLAALRIADQAAEAQLRERLESVELKLHAKVMRPDRPIPHVYFPETGVLSHIQQMHDEDVARWNENKASVERAIADLKEGREKASADLKEAREKAWAEF